MSHEQHLHPDNRMKSRSFILPSSYYMMLDTIAEREASTPTEVLKLLIDERYASHAPVDSHQNEISKK